MKTLVAVLLVVLLSPAPGLSGDADLQGELQNLLDQTLKENPQVPGISLFVMCPQRGLDWSGASGFISRDTDIAFSPENTFRIASNTKTYVAASILRLAEMGKLGLDDPLEPYLPTTWRTMLAKDGYKLKAMTLRMVLSHTSGLNDHASDDRYGAAVLENPQRPWSPEDQLGMLVEWFDPVGWPGEKYSYSDDGYIILGNIVEQKTGLSLGSAVRSLLDFDALGLHNTWWEVMEAAPAKAGDRAHQFYFDEDTFDWNPSLDLYGGGGLLADTRDLGLFMRKLLRGEVLETEEMLHEMTTSGTGDYRLGLIELKWGSHKVLGHTGFWNTFAYYVPELDLTISGCILNHDGIRGVELAEKVAGLVGGE